MYDKQCHSQLPLQGGWKYALHLQGDSSPAAFGVVLEMNPKIRTEAVSTELRLFALSGADPHSVQIENEASVSSAIQQ
jgi:hypothetical protein